MTLQERIQQELKASMLARNADKTSLLRQLKSAIGYVQIERKVDSLSDADVTALIQKEVKKRRDSIKQFTTGGRPELAEKEAQEISLLEAFLPQPFSADELEKLVRETILGTGAMSNKDMGAVIKSVQAQAAGRAEGKTISALVGRLLP